MTEFGRSINDYCLIHNQRCLDRGGKKCSRRSDITKDHFSDCRDVVLTVLADKKQISHIMIVGLAANYRTSDQKLLTLSWTEVESLPFCEALNTVLTAIAL